MEIILVGYPGSQRIVKASQYLTKKYLPEFDITYLNYEGHIEGWASFVAGALSMAPLGNVILSLDDYLLAGPINKFQYAIGKCEVSTNEVVCVKLCKSTPEEHAEYPITTQYCLWDKEFLIWLLNQVRTPWQFEIEGSKIFRTTGKKVLHRPCIDYYTNSSISGRWEGVNLEGLKEEDVNYLKENGII